MVSTFLALLSFAYGCPETRAYASTPPALEDTEACVRSYVESVYGRDLDPGTIEMDVPAGAGELLKLAGVQIENGLRAMGSVCSGCRVDVCDWRDIYCLRFAAAQNLFERERAARATTVDASTGVDIAPLIAILVKGEPLDAKQLQVKDGKSGLSPLSLWRLRNVVFARHGRKFQSSELSAFFSKDYKGNQSRIRVARGGGWRVYGNLFVRAETPMIGELGFRCAAAKP